MNGKNPVLDLLGHFPEIGRFCDVCSIGMEDAVRMAQELERIRGSTSQAAVVVDAWWRSFVVLIATLSDLHSQVTQGGLEKNDLRSKVDGVVGDLAQTSEALFKPFEAQLQNLEPGQVGIIKDIAIDLLDSILVKFMALESSL